MRAILIRALSLTGAGLLCVASAASAQTPPAEPVQTPPAEPVQAPAEPAADTHAINAELRFSGPGDCPDVEVLRRGTEEILGRALASRPEPPGLILDIRVEEQPAGMAAELSMSWRDGRQGGMRSLTTTDHTCQTLARGLPLVAAMLVDLTQREATMQLPQVEHGTEALSPALGGGLRVGAGFDLGLLPEPVFYPEITLNISPFPWLMVLARGAILSPQTHNLGSNRGVGVWGVLAGLGVCIPVDLPPFRLAGCGAVESGWFSTYGVGFDRVRENESFHLAAEADVRVELIALRPWVLGLKVGGLVPIIGQRFVAQVGEEEISLFTSSAIGLRAGLWMGVSW